MKLPTKSSLRGALGFDAIVFEDDGTVYVTSIESGETHAVSLVRDTEYLNPEFGDVADVIADRIAVKVTSDMAVYSLQAWEDVLPDCPFCGI